MLGMGRDSREVWEKRVERWRDSGLTAKEFASEVGVNAKRLQNWSWRLAAERRRAAREVASAPASVQSLQFVEVATTATSAASEQPQSSPFEIVLVSGATVRIPARFEADGLRRLLAVIG